MPGLTCKILCSRAVVMSLLPSEVFFLCVFVMVLTDHARLLILAHTTIHRAGFGFYSKVNGKSWGEDTQSGKKD